MFPFLLALLFILKIRLGVQFEYFRIHSKNATAGRDQEIIQNI